MHSALMDCLSSLDACISHIPLIDVKDVKNPITQTETSEV